MPAPQRPTSRVLSAPRQAQAAGSRPVRIGIASLLTGLLTACGPATEPRPAAPPSAPAPPRTVPDPAAHPGEAWFTAVGTGSGGPEFTHESEFSGRHLFPEIMGSGAAFLDADNDGRLDLVFLHNTAPTASVRNRLYLQQPDGRFRDATAGSGLERPGRGQGLAAGDLTHDGLPELLITEADGVRLLLNRGGGRFTDITAAAGLTNAYWSIPAAFVDYDRDGWLDLVLGNYLDFDATQRCLDARGQPEFCGPHGFRPTPTRLFRHTGRPGPDGIPQFTDVTVASGLARVPGKAMQIVCADFDGDRWPDLFVSDDALPNRLFINRRDGTFRDEAVERGVAYTGMGTPAANMGIALGDVDANGLFDLFIPHLTEENHTLWRQTAQGLFEDDTARAGLLNLPWHGTGFGAVLGDFNNDGASDLAVVNGRIRRPPGAAATVPARRPLMSGIASPWQPYAEPAQLFRNDGSGRFREISASNSALCGEAMVGRGLAMGDFDNDGGLDLLVVGLGGPARLLRNTAPRGHWLGLRVVEPAFGSRDALGAEVVVTAAGREYWRLAHPAFSYASSNDPRVHVGLGPATTFDRVRVRWPDGTEELFPGGPVDRYLTLRHGSGQVIPPPSTPGTPR